MTSRLEQFSFAQDGTVSLESARGFEETNVAVWEPTNPTAFNKACDATIFTRLETRHTHLELKAAFDATPSVDQTFYMSVNNVILVFSASIEEHRVHVEKVLEMMWTHSMRAVPRDCVYDLFCLLFP